MIHEKAMKDIEEVLLNYYNKGTFTACGLGFSKLENNHFSTSRLFCGKTAEGQQAEKVTEETYFDVASLTKALVTIPCLLALLKKGKLSLQQTLPELLDYDVPHDKVSITLEQLIGHYAGLPAHKKYHESPYRQKLEADSGYIVPLVLGEPLVSRPGESYCYSDLDYMLLGEIIERASGEELASFWKKTITDPLGLSDHFYLMESLSDSHGKIFAETGCCPWSGRVLRGLVHDDNCRVLARASGHAGLFSTLDGILFLCNSILLNYLGKKSHPSFNNEDLRYFTGRRGGEARALGFDVPEEKGSSAGSHFSFNSIGHLGYTGTSFWIDLDKRISVILLTNRVYFGDDSESMRSMRPDIHDRVMRTLLKK